MQIKSKERVNKFAEVFTAEREVKAMCDLIPPDLWQDIVATYLEPACGNGAFLKEILARKLSRCITPAQGLCALESIANIRYDNGNYYRTRELAEQDAKELALRGRVRQLRDALCEGYQYNNNPDIRNWVVVYDFNISEYRVTFSSVIQDIGVIWFDTKEHAQKACDILNNELEKERGVNG